MQTPPSAPSRPARPCWPLHRPLLSGALVLAILGCSDQGETRSDGSWREVDLSLARPAAAVLSATACDDLTPPFLALEPTLEVAAPAERNGDGALDGEVESPAQSSGSQRDRATRSPTYWTAAHDSQPGRVDSAVSQGMTLRLLDTCLAQAGDAMPSAPLSDLDGRACEWTDFAGPQGTVLVLWSSRELYSLEQLAQLEQEKSKWPLSLGVAVVAVNVGDSPQTARALVERHGVTTPCLLDEHRDLFRKIATERLPRTYVLDAQRRVAWLDTEWSRFTREGIAHAVSCLTPGE